MPVMSGRKDKWAVKPKEIGYKPILCLDFDGVLHSYTSGWQGADIIQDPPVAGAQEFVRNAIQHFKVVIHSSRCDQPGGKDTILQWLNRYGFPFGIELVIGKPSAHVTLDDRGLTFDGKWPNIQDLLEFKPWNKQ